VGALAAADAASGFRLVPPHAPKAEATAHSATKRRLVFI
jgi:hypothetical protein